MLYSPSELLKGKKLEDGWKVIDIIRPSNKATGGNFSVCYIVESENGEKAFLKTPDLMRALRDTEPLKLLQHISKAFNFERELLKKCKDHKLNHVVSAITEGKTKVDEFTIEYLIFELADGDIRKHLEFINKFDLAWVLRSLHNISIGIQELHGINIAHQDIKPSNILIFNKKISKITDLGRSSVKGTFSLYDDENYAGDPNYSPPELLYGYISDDWNKRRFGCDMYMMGSMLVFFFTQLSMTTLLFKEMHEKHNHNNWEGSYLDVLPYIRDAFGRVIEIFKDNVIKELREDLGIVVSELCEPDPALRGHPRDKEMIYGNQYSLERYISHFNLLAEKAEYNLFRY